MKTSADAAAREQLAKVVEVLARDKVASFEDCIAWARLKFQVGTWHLLDSQQHCLRPAPQGSLQALLTLLLVDVW